MSHNPKFPTAVTAVMVGQGAIIGNTDQPPVLQPASETDMDNNLKDTSPTEKPPLTDETTPPQGTLLQPPLLNTGWNHYPSLTISMKRPLELLL